MVVYDGDMRPKFKRGKNVKSTPHWLTESVRQMASLFGFENHTVGLQLARIEARILTKLIVGSG